MDDISSHAPKGWNSESQKETKESNEVKYRPNAIKNPGQVLKEALVDLDISYRDFIQMSGIDGDYFYRFLDGKAVLTETLADRLERWTKIPAWYWLRQERRWRRLKEEGLV